MRYSHPNAKMLHEHAWDIDYSLVSQWVQSAYNNLGGSGNFIETAKKVIDGEVSDIAFDRARTHIENGNSAVKLSVLTPSGHMESTVGKANEGHVFMKYKRASRGVTSEILFDTLAGGSMPGSIRMTITKNLLITQFEAFFTSPLIIETSDKNTLITIRVLYEYKDQMSIQIKNSFFIELQGEPYEINLNRDGTILSNQSIPENLKVTFNTVYFVKINDLEIQFPKEVDLQNGIIKYFLKNKQLAEHQHLLK